MGNLPSDVDMSQGEEQKATVEVQLKNITAKVEAARLGDTPVKSFMSRNAVSVPTGTKIYSAVQMLAAHKVGSAPVVDGQQKIVGIISEHDLLIQTAVRDISSPIQFSISVVSITPETTLREAIALLYKMKVRRIPVVQRGEIMGIVTRMDVLSRLIGRDTK